MILEEDAYELVLISHLRVNMSKEREIPSLAGRPPLENLNADFYVFPPPPLNHYPA